VKYDDGNASRQGFVPPVGAGLWTSVEAAAFLNISMTQFERMMKAGGLQPVVLPGCVRLRRFRPDDVRSLVEGAS
jgi:hypothetical protein